VFESARTVVGIIAWVGFLAICILWLIVAINSDPTWWWFVPIYGDIKIFGESVWYGLFHVSLLPAALIAGLMMSDDY
jgi:hypothetical protein